MRFRTAILGMGNIEGSTVLLENLLGKNPGVEALHAHMGINVTTGA